MDKQFNDIHNAEVRLFLILTIALVALFIISFISGSISKRKNISVPTQVATSPFEQINLEAKAIYVYDARTRTVLFAKNADDRLPLASLTKLMSTLVATDLDLLDNTITISREALDVEGDSGLRLGEKWSLRNLLDFSLMTSSNDGMHAVALALGALKKEGTNSEKLINDFVGLMNRKASFIGLKNTYFWNETGLDETDIKGGGYSTARDMGTFTEYILRHYPEMLLATKEDTTTFQSLDSRLHVAKNTNIIVSDIPGIMASKTGFTDIAGGNVVFVFDPELGRPIIVSILGSTEDGRFRDAEQLVNAVMAYIRQH